MLEGVTASRNDALLTSDVAGPGDPSQTGGMRSIRVELGILSLSDIQTNPETGVPFPVL